jgi:hypothetical protein
MDVENTDLERRVLAHEQILQVLIAHMAEAEPKVLDRYSRYSQNTTHWALASTTTPGYGRIRRAVYPASNSPERQSGPQLGLSGPNALRVD